MKIWSFIKWRWRTWETWQQCYIVGAFIAGAGVFAPRPYDGYLFAIPAIMLFVWTGKWWIWDAVKESYQKFEKDQQNLFEIIKNSDKHD